MAARINPEVLERGRAEKWSVEPRPRLAYAVVGMQTLKVKSKPPRIKKPTPRLSPRQLRRLADRMVEATDPTEVARLKGELERGFYGDSVHA